MPLKRLKFAIFLWIWVFAGIAPGAFAKAPEAAPGRLANAQRGSVEYFTIWSYTRNAPSEPLEPEQLSQRSLGYWELRMDSAGAVESAAFHASDGALWLSIRYVEEGGHVYADVYSATGAFVVRKSTQLQNRLPQSAR